MAFLMTFLLNIVMAIVIIVVYSGMFVLIIRHYAKSRDVVESEDFFLTEHVRINKMGDVVLKVVCVAMIVFIVGSLVVFLYQLLDYYSVVVF